MDFPDLLIARDPGDAVLVQALATLFGVTPGGIFLGEGVEFPDGELPPTTQIVVGRRPVKGEAVLHVRVTPLAAEFDALMPSRRDVQRGLRRLARLLDAAVIVDDDSLDPSAFLRIAPSGLVEALALDIGALDAEDRAVPFDSAVTPTAP